MDTSLRARRVRRHRRARCGRVCLCIVVGRCLKRALADNLVELIKQRRRWLNGSFFSLVYYISNFGRCARQSPAFATAV